MAKKKKRALKRKPVKRSKSSVSTRSAIARRNRAAKSNPPKRLTKSTAWMPATAVKIVKRRGQPDQVLIRKPAGKKRTRKGKGRK